MAVDWSADETSGSPTPYHLPARPSRAPPKQDAASFYTCASRPCPTDDGEEKEGREQAVRYGPAAIIVRSIGRTGRGHGIPLPAAPVRAVFLPASARTIIAPRRAELGHVPNCSRTVRGPPSSARERTSVGLLLALNVCPPSSPRKRTFTLFALLFSYPPLGDSFKGGGGSGSCCCRPITGCFRT